MADVRLTATNPDDSTVVPVACNAKGELLLEEPPTFDGNVDGNLNVTGSGTFSNYVLSGGNPYLGGADGSKLNATGYVDASRSSGSLFLGYKTGKTSPNVDIKSDGSADFQGGVLVNPDNDYATYLGRGSGGVSVPGYIETKRDCDSNGDVALFSGTEGSIQLKGDGAINADGRVSARELETGNALSGAGGYGFYVSNGNTIDGKYTGVVVKQDTNASNAWPCFGAFKAGVEIASIKWTGGAVFTSDVIVGSRNKKWMIVESNGLAHLVEQTDSKRFPIDTADLVDEIRPAEKVSYPELRDIPGELTMVEQQLQKVMERLKMAPEAGWEVWDGSD